MAEVGGPLTHSSALKCAFALTLALLLRESWKVQRRVGDLNNPKRFFSAR